MAPGPTVMAPQAQVRRFTQGRRDAPSTAIGTVAGGVEGFRQSHREAEGARRVALIGVRAQPTLIGASDPGLSIAALLGGDVARVRCPGGQRAG